MQQQHLDFPGYRQDDWVDLQHWIGADWDNMISLWVAHYRHLAWLVEHIDPASLKHPITIEGFGPSTLEFIVPDYVEHMKHHLKQIFPQADLTNRFVTVYNT